MNEIKLEKKNICSLEMLNLYVKKAVFERKEIVPKNFSVKFDVDFDYKEENKVEVILSCYLKDAEETMRCEIIMIGCFKTTDEDLVIAKTLLKKNSVAIMFPYLRSYITTLSSQPNLPPLILPPVNINQLLDELKK